ncbi:hypothetical protein [Clostridium uliginosum]|uniref:Uncharacterized protein n=1 Tax=Clostridium uliginosum TaxID=119641 RepID=A0A1I1KA01_9CLOT|nr:hypothetical protein [Clostridium uliginosum]SFC55528.1 hypothetical protein SAMN05421842_10556 [Clostridium uliginosum]
MKKKTWIIIVDGISYNIELKQKLFSKKLFVNNEEVPFEKSKYLGMANETHFMLGIKEAVLVSLGNKIDVAIDGKYLNSGREYVALERMPAWTWIFIVLNGLVIIGGGALPFLLAFMGMTLSIRISLSQRINTFLKVLLSFLLTSINYILFISLAMLASSIR